MAKKHHTPEQIIHLLRQAEVELAAGHPELAAHLGDRLSISRCST
jgi:hypothetical protein